MGCYVSTVATGQDYEVCCAVGDPWIAEFPLLAYVGPLTSAQWYLLCWPYGDELGLLRFVRSLHPVYATQDLELDLIWAGLEGATPNHMMRAFLLLDNHLVSLHMPVPGDDLLR